MPRNTALTYLSGSLASMPQMVVKKIPVKIEVMTMQGMTRYSVRLVSTENTNRRMEIIRVARDTLTLVENHLKKIYLEHKMTLSDCFSC